MHQKIVLFLQLLSGVHFRHVKSRRRASSDRLSRLGANEAPAYESWAGRDLMTTREAL